MLIAKKNISDDIYLSLKKGILSGNLTPGTRLKQQEIAKIYGASLIPVREALRSLEMEGLVTLSANKGAVVSEISAHEAKEIFEVRLVLEKGAMAMAIENYNDAQVIEAEKILLRMDESDDASELSELNRTFHETLYKACQNQKLIDLIAQHYQSIDRYMRLYLINSDHSTHSQNIHKNLLDAFRGKDVKMTLALLEAHMTTAKDELIEEIIKSKEVENVNR